MGSKRGERVRPRANDCVRRMNGRVRVVGRDEPNFLTGTTVARMYATMTFVRGIRSWKPECSWEFPKAACGMTG